ncbi:MAG: hypothetical protein HY912_13935 [Desulfomonile tiedjei]|uniref:Uncharacterized protein n=1 Tax=Desulfomonile tiedjei TaxID=2358 RepID=A0A9D6V5Z6_9BACT|nr:hypothetical protein [Desulfomonile tiedjei]
MADQQKPDVTGKGPAFIRETLVVFGEINGQCATLSKDAAEKIKATLSSKGQEIEPLLSRAYMKTVKAGETALACRQLADLLKSSVTGCDEAKAMENLDKLGAELDGLIHKVKTFVVRMT